MAGIGSVVGLQDVREWGRELDAVARRIGARFPRSETRDRVRAYLVGLFGPVRRKNAWQVAEQIGDADPYGVQYLMGRSEWDPDAVRDDLRGYVVEVLGDPDAVLVLDETGFLKKGTRSAGVARQYTGTAGRIENAQAGVFLAYAGPDGSRALIDRELYLPEKWAGDRDRCRAAGIGDDVAVATKPELARRGDRLAALVPRQGWQRLSCADGSKGPRLYDWALIGTGSPHHHLLVRRSLSPGEKGELELAYFRCWSPRPVTLPEIVAVAGARWGIEMVFPQLAKGPVRPVGRGRKDVADLDVAAGDDHAVGEQFGELASLFAGSVGQPGPDGLAECLDPVGDGLKFEPLLGGGVQLPLLGKKGGVAAVQFLAFAFQFGQSHHFGEVGVQQPLLLAV